MLHNESQAVAIKIIRFFFNCFSGIQEKETQFGCSILLSPAKSAKEKSLGITNLDSLMSRNNHNAL